MTKIRKRGSYSAAQKENVSLETLKGEKTLRQIASENNNVNANLSCRAYIVAAHPTNREQKQMKNL